MKDGRIYDGSDAVVAIDADTHPSYLPATFDSSAVNRTYRGGIRRTRPPFTEIQLTGDADDVEAFKAGNFQGAYAYSSVKYGSSDGIAVSVAGSIYFLSISNSSASVTKIADGNDPTLMHTWFCQAEDRLYIQNGKQLALSWGGTTDVPYRLNPILNQMPVGTVMEYAHGRVWVSDRTNRIFASDIIFGTGFTETTNTQSFTEQTYWNEGGSFTPPTKLGSITGMKVMPYIGANTRGQGELVVLCERGAFTLDGSISRTSWIDTGIQRVALFGRGCTSPWSTVSVNNELFFRSDDGWSLFRNSQSEFNGTLAYRKLSREVNKWVSKDTPWMRQFASAMFFDNRIICTVSPYTVSNKDTSMGLHRPHRGMVVLDLDQTTATSPDGGISFRWNGLWTGPRPTQLLTANISGVKRAFAFSFDEDNKNHLYELREDGEDDFVDGTSKKIKSYFITKRYDFADSGKTNKFYTKGLNGGSLFASEISDEVSISASFRTDSYPCWNELMPKITFGCSNADKEGCTAEFSEHLYKQFKFLSPDDVCGNGVNGLSTSGYEFQILVEMEGSVAIDRLRISSDTRGNVEDPTGDCTSDSIECDPITCCPIDDFNYYKLIE